MPRIRFLFTAIFSAAFFATAPGHAAIRLVHTDGSGDAPSVAAALAASTTGDQIVLSPGTYFEHDLELVDGVILRGQTGSAEDVVIDAGSLGRVLRAVQVGADTAIDGITLRGGLVQGSCATDPGTGAYCMGGGAFLLEAAPSFTNCVFVDNRAEDNGGAVASILSAPTFLGCSFSGNIARHGGAMTFAASSLGGMVPQIQYCVFESNHADADGGAIYTYLSDPLIARCTFRANESGEQGSSIFWYEPTPPIVDRCIFAFGQGGEAMFSGIAGAAPTLECCNVAGNAGGDWVGCLAGQELVSGNLSLDPLFCDAQGAELRGNSPCVTSNCGFIGATSAVCVATSVGDEIESRSWGLLKATYRSSSSP